MATNLAEVFKAWREAIKVFEISITNVQRFPQ